MYCINRLVFDIGMRVEFAEIIARDAMVPRHARPGRPGGRANHSTFAGAARAPKAQQPLPAIFFEQISAGWIWPFQVVVNTDVRMKAA